MYTCSADREEAYASYAPPRSPSPHSDSCDGWDGEDAHGRPVPCRVCKQPLRHRLRRQRQRIREGIPLVR